MFSSFSKLLRIPVAPRKAFSTTVESAEFRIYSTSDVMDPNFKHFNVNDCRWYNGDSGNNYMAYIDSCGVKFRKVRFANPPEGYVCVLSDGSTGEDHIIPELQTNDTVGDSTAAAVKRSDKGVLLNSCAVKLGVADVLTAEAKGAHLGLLMSDNDEKVELRLESQDVAILLMSHIPVPPKSCEDLIFEMRSMIETKRKNGGILKVWMIDRITNLLPNRMAQLPKTQGWDHPIGLPKFYERQEDLPTEELKTILVEDMLGTYRFARKIKKRKSDYA